MPANSHAASQHDLLAARAGSREALGRLLESWRPYLMSRARQRLCHNVQARFDAEDVVQETLMKAVEKFPDFRGETPAQGLAWILRILDHKLDDLHRDCHREIRNVAKEVHLSSGAALDMLEGLALVAETPEAALEWQEQLADVRQALAELAEPHRTVVWLHFGQDRTYAAIGQQLGWTKMVVKKLAQQAVQHLRGRLVACSRKAALLSGALGTIGPVHAFAAKAEFLDFLGRSRGERAVFATDLHRLWAQQLDRQPGMSAVLRDSGPAAGAAAGAGSCGLPEIAGHLWHGRWPRRADLRRQGEVSAFPAAELFSPQQSRTQGRAHPGTHAVARLGSGHQ